MDAACEHIDERLTPFYPSFIREVTKEDILKLMEIKMGRILKFNSDKADELIARMKEDIAEIDDHLAHIVDYTVNWYQMLKNKYGKNFPRRTELRNFDTIEAAKVVEANEKLYINREEGFIGTALKKDEFVAHCSDIDDIFLLRGWQPVRHVDFPLSTNGRTNVLLLAGSGCSLPNGAYLSPCGSHPACRYGYLRHIRNILL